MKTPWRTGWRSGFKGGDSASKPLYHFNGSQLAQLANVWNPLGNKTKISADLGVGADGVVFNNRGDGSTGIKLEVSGGSQKVTIGSTSFIGSAVLSSINLTVEGNNFFLGAMESSYIGDPLSNNVFEIGENFVSSISGLRLTDLSPMQNKSLIRGNLVNLQAKFPTLNIDDGYIEFSMAYQATPTDKQVLFTSLLEISADGRLVPGSYTVDLKVDGELYDDSILVDGRHYEISFVASQGFLSKIGYNSCVIYNPRLQLISGHVYEYSTQDGVIIENTNSFTGKEGEEEFGTVGQLEVLGGGWIDGQTIHIRNTGDTFRAVQYLDSAAEGKHYKVILSSTSNVSNPDCKLQFKVEDLSNTKQVNVSSGIFACTGNTIRMGFYVDGTYTTAGDTFTVSFVSVKETTDGFWMNLTEEAETMPNNSHYFPMHEGSGSVFNDGLGDNDATVVLGHSEDNWV